MDDFALEAPAAGDSFPEQGVEEGLPAVAEVFGAGEEDNGGIAEDFCVVDFGGLSGNCVADDDLARGDAAEEGEHLVGGELDEATGVCDADANKVRGVCGSELVHVGGVCR